MTISVHYCSPQSLIMAYRNMQQFLEVPECRKNNNSALAVNLVCNDTTIQSSS